MYAIHGGATPAEFTELNGKHQQKMLQKIANIVILHTCSAFFE
jgi:hypothetical protein